MLHQILQIQNQHNKQTNSPQQTNKQASVENQHQISPNFANGNFHAQQGNVA